MNDKRIHLHIYGRVQGVGYRQSAQSTATALEVRGWVRNLPDGSVELAAEGSDGAVKNFLSWCHHGPRFAKVVSVEHSDEEPLGDSRGFQIV
ncbi:MAG TPA: acylphosphatase [Pseudomonadales bacterium]|nr:acylphosphatase [Gammaproteobacteria bacterium]HIM35516.1 acylphosphatase [Pseudomonadales bacterium]